MRAGPFLRYPLVTGLWWGKDVLVPTRLTTIVCIGPYVSIVESSYVVIFIHLPPLLLISTRSNVVIRMSVLEAWNSQSLARLHSLHGGLGPHLVTIPDINKSPSSPVRQLF